MPLVRALVLVPLLVIFIAGCPGNADKEINKNKEKPVPPAAEKQEKADKK